MSANLTSTSHRRVEQAYRLPQETEIVAFSPEYLRQNGLSHELRIARGRLTLIEHEKGVAYGCVTWDFPGIDDRVPLDVLICATDLFRRR